MKFFWNFWKRHEHKYTLAGYRTDFKHILDSSGKLGKCPYPGCTQKFRVYMCQTCADRKEVEVDA